MGSTPTPSNLLGFHIDTAGSPNGPWQRLTTHPVAWWERHYIAQGVGLRFPCDYTGHTECLSYRVIAVDEAGNESAPVKATPDSPLPSYCQPATPIPPANLRASTDNSATPAATYCKTKLEWDTSPGATEYYVHRWVSRSNFLHFYDTQRVDAIASDTQTYTELGTDWTDDCNLPYQSCSTPLPSQGCYTGAVDAYYVTARTSTGGESPRSNLVFWNCADPFGYTKVLTDASQADAIAALTVPHPDGPLACWSDDREGTEALAAPPPEPGTQRVAALTTTPMLRLGEVSNPPWGMVDLHSDHLGSVRLITDLNGQVVSQHNYFPFGEEIPPETVSYNTHQYTGHERDKTTGLDYMLARYYGNTGISGDNGNHLPRFLSPDPAGGRPSDPLSWNKYSYVRNDPMILVDPTGMYWAPGTPMPILPGDPNGCTRCILVVDPTAPASWQSRTRGLIRDLQLSNPRLAAMIQQLQDSDNNHVLTPSDGGSNTRATDWDAATNGTGSGSTIYFDVDQFESDNTPSHPAAVLAHELSHAEDEDKGHMDQQDYSYRSRVSEGKAVRMENLANRSLGTGIPTKTFYQGLWYYFPKILIAFPTSVPPQW